MMNIKAAIYLEYDPKEPWAEIVRERVNGSYDNRGDYMMTEDDMSYMEDVFITPLLPFDEYLVECGYHSMTKEFMEREKALDADGKSALRDMMSKYGLHFLARYRIPCQGGAVFQVTVICGKMFYSRIGAPYEIMGPSTERISDGYISSDDPLPYQTDEDLMVYLAKLIEKAKEY